MSITTSKTLGVTKELLDYLAAKVCINKVPDVSMTDREIWIEVGKQEVLKKLKQLHLQETL